MTLDDRYLIERGTVYLTGIQALVRLPIDQMRRDRRAGLKTGTFISGYEGSPIGGYDMALARVNKLLAEYNVHFVPGVNEDLAATSVFGSQISDVFGGRTVDGVFGIWYGKGPGVDRSGDALRHGNIAGTGPGCAALALAGDDHACKSSTIPHQSDLSFFNLGMPVFYPGNTQEILDYGLLAVGLSRFSGAWVGMKLVTNICDGGGTVIADPDRCVPVTPPGFDKKCDPRLVPPMTLAMEHEVNRRRIEAAREFARLNDVNRWYGAQAAARLGILTAGKSYYDVVQALANLGIARGDLEELGLRIGKLGMTFPVERNFAREFADGLETILVIEEKRSFIEFQLRDVLCNLPRHPIVIGKEDEEGRPLIPASGELDPDLIATLIAARLGRARCATKPVAKSYSVPSRRPNYCPGCPHNRSTVLFEGQVAAGGIGCHGMGIMLADADRGYAFCTQMGGEGAPWIGIAPFVDRQHIFQNIGDGTLFHSGQLAITACVAAGVNITFKILYNSAVAMTGGQQAEGMLPIPELTKKLEAEGVHKTAVVAEDPDKYDGVELAANASVRHRDDLADVMRELEKITGVTVIIYDQRCAAEKRRLRSRGKLEEPARRLVIHEEVCEGCGDCVKQSNCMSLYPVETEFGQKMRIHQSSCNKDYTCLLGDCPSFVTVNLKPGTGLRKRTLPDLPQVDVPMPREIAGIGSSGYRILAPGIGGTGVVTVNALLATAALIDGLAVTTLDQTGLAQKGGAVVSHLVLSREPIETAARINTANADLLLGFDLLGAAASDNLKCAHPERTVAVVNTAETPTGDAIRGKLQLAGPQRMIDLIDETTRRGSNAYIDASRLAEGLFGTHIAVNLLLTGAAWQAGLIPLSLASIEQAIRLNGIEAERNLQVFAWGRKYYHDAQSVESFLSPRATKQTAADLVEHRRAELAAYQNDRYAEEFVSFVRSVEERAPELRDIVARSLYKLMANKDEYEVARLLTKSDFTGRLNEQWEAIESIEYNLHPPLLRAWGVRKKMRLGGWFHVGLKLLAALKPLRGTSLDVFGYSSLRRLERGLPGWYRDLVQQVLKSSTAEGMEMAREILALPDQIRGYEEIRRRNIEATQKLAAEKLARLRETIAEGVA